MFISNNLVFFLFFIYFLKIAGKKNKELGTNHSCGKTANVSARIRKKRNASSKLQAETPCWVYNVRRKVPWG